MNEPHLPESAGARLGQVVEGDGANLCRTKGMQVEHVLDRDLLGVVIHQPDYAILSR